MTVMTYNVFCAGDGVNHWCRRQPLVRDMIKLYEPDIFGLQEAHYGWMRYTVNQFKDKYDFVGVGKDDGDKKGEYSPLFYKKDKYELLDSGNFWLSETPDVPSLGWDADENRTCAYALLENKETGEKIAAFNTHLDHMGLTAMCEGIKLVIESTKKYGNTKIVVTGDFNVTPDSHVYALMLENGFFDARTVAESSNDIESFHYYGIESKMIDFIFVKNGFNVKEVKTATDKFNGRDPSDHYPVVAQIY